MVDARDGLSCGITSACNLTMSEEGLVPYLILLSIHQTCRYKGVNFLKVLLSRETDIDVFRERRGKRQSSSIELYLEGSQSVRLSRKRLGPNSLPTDEQAKCE